MTEEKTPAPDKPTTPLRELIAGLIGGLIAVACVLPPLLHFVSGPLGAFIGGFFAANHVKPAARGRIIIAVATGTFLAGLVGTLAKFAAAYFGSKPPDWFPAPEMFGAILGGVWLYGTLLSFGGTMASAAFAEKKARS